MLTAIQPPVIAGMDRLVAARDYGANLGPERTCLTGVKAVPAHDGHRGTCFHEDVMTNLELLKLELPRLRELARSASAEEANVWSRASTDALHFEIRWCIETLQEFDVRLSAAVAQA